MIVWNLFLVGKLFVLIWGLGKFFLRKDFFKILKVFLRGVFIIKR
jgi:hypothetical protein